MLRVIYWSFLDIYEEQIADMVLLSLLILGAMVQGHLALSGSDCGTSFRRPGITLHVLSSMISVIAFKQTKIMNPFFKKDIRELVFVLQSTPTSQCIVGLNL